MRKTEKKQRERITVVSDHAIFRYKEIYSHLWREPISLVKKEILSHFRRTTRCNPCAGGGITYRTNTVKFVTSGDTIVTVIHHTRRKYID